MKVATFSICVGTNWCNAGCPFCISKATGAKGVPKPETPDYNNFMRAMRDAQISQVKNVLLTGTGEPTGYPSQIDQYLGLMNHAFPYVDLQTNGILINELPLEKWRLAGLSTVCISAASMHPKTNQQLMRGSDVVDIDEAIETIQKAGLTARINFTMMKGGVDTLHEVEAIVDWARTLETPIQLTFRDITAPPNGEGHNSEVIEKIKKLQVNLTPDLHQILSSDAVKHLEYDYGGVVYGWKNQNICISNCITSDSDPEKQRQLIYFPNGRIGYDWKHTRSAFIL
jgi:molybdenum cofactor biosynthesis enzyme MoaA